MTDKQKTKDELIEELEDMRQRIQMLENKIPELLYQFLRGPQIGKARPPRVGFNANIDVKGDFDTLEAQGINLSHGGICFECSQPLAFDMHFAFEDKPHDGKAELVWSRHMEKDKYRFGFRFV